MSSCQPSSVKEYTCIYCGAPTARHPNEQEPPFDYCHPEDHESFDDVEGYFSTSAIVPCPLCGFPRLSNNSGYGCALCSLSIADGSLVPVTVTKNV